PQRKTASPKASSIEIPRNTSIRRDPIRKERRRSRATSCDSAMAAEAFAESALRATQRKSRPTESRRAAPGYNGCLGDTETLQSRPVNGRCYGQAAIALEIRERRTRPRSEQTVDGIIIITLFLERGLDVGYYLARREIVVTIDRLVVGIGTVVRIIAVGGVPIAVVPIIITAAEENDPAEVAPPPAAVVPVPMMAAPRLFEGECPGRVVVPPVAVRVRPVLPIAVPHCCVRVRLVLPIAVPHCRVRVRLDIRVRCLIRDNVSPGAVTIRIPIRVVR